MKFVSKLTAFFLALVTLLLLTSCTRDEKTEDTTSDTAPSSTGAVKTKETMLSFDYEIDSETKASLSFVGKEGKAEKVKVSTTGHAPSEIDLTAVSDKVLSTSDGVVFDGSEDSIRTVDINLDGHLDFLLKAWDEDSYTPFFTFLWNPDNASFVYACVLGNPYVESTSGRVFSNVYSDGAEAVYIYEPSEMSLILRDSWAPSEELEFLSDISQYEEYIEPAEADEYLILVNDDNTLDMDYVPEDLFDLVDTRNDGRNTQQMRLYAAKALEALLIEMRESGYRDVSVTSAYRDYQYQEGLFNSYVEQEMQNGLSNEEALKKVRTYSAEAGTSEHQTGLCCDMHNLPAADQAFKEERSYKWLKENSWKFGFVLRFPEDKETVTDIEFEPWHYRFVGRYNADKMNGLGMCLEEYTSYLNGMIK